MDLLGPLQPAVEALFAARHERIVAAEVVSTFHNRRRQQRNEGTDSTPKRGLTPPHGSTTLTGGGRREDKVPALLVLCTPMDGAGAAHAKPEGGALASAAGVGAPTSALPALSAASRDRTSLSSSAAHSVLYTLDIKSDTQVKLRHSLPLSRLVGTSHDSSSTVDLTFDFGGSGMISVQFESNIQREMMFAAIYRLKGTSRGQAAPPAPTTAEEDSAASPQQRRHGVFTAQEEEQLLQYIGGGGLDDTQHFQEVLLHSQKSTELKLLHTLVESSSLWATAKAQVHNLVRDVEAVEQRIALHSTNLLAKRLTIQMIEHENNTLQRKKRNLEELLETVKRLRDLLQLDPSAEVCLQRLSDTEDAALPQFFEDPKNIQELSAAMRHMHEVIQDVNLQQDFPIAAVRERKAYFQAQRRMIVFRSKAFLFALMEQFEKKYLNDASRRSRSRTLVWLHHTELFRVLLEMAEIMKATGRIDMEGFTSLLRRYRVCMRRVYGVELTAFFDQLHRQLQTCTKPFLIGTETSSKRLLKFRQTTLSPGDALPQRGLLPLPSYAELRLQAPPRVLLSLESASPLGVDGAGNSPLESSLNAQNSGTAVFHGPSSCWRGGVDGIGGIASSATAARMPSPAEPVFSRAYSSLDSGRAVETADPSSSRARKKEVPLVIPDVPEKRRLVVELPFASASPTASSLFSSELQLYADPNRLLREALHIQASYRCEALPCFCAAASTTGKGKGDAALRPDFAFAIALQCTMEALLMEETVLSQCFGIEEGTHRRYGGFATANSTNPSVFSHESLPLNNNNSMNLSPRERKAYQEQQGHLLQECLIELFGGDKSFSIIEQIQGIGARMLWVGNAVKRTPHGLLHRRRRRAGSAGESSDGEIKAAEDDVAEEDRDGQAPLGGEFDPDNEKTVTNSKLFFHTQRILQKNFLFVMLSKLANRIAHYCDLTYSVPIMCMLQRYMTAAVSAPNAAATFTGGEGNVVEEQSAAPSVSGPTSHVSPSSPVSFPAAPTSQSTFAMVLLREVETIMAGAVMRHVQEQGNSIAKGKKAYCIHPTPLFCGFTNLPLYVFRMEAMLNALSPAVCDNAQYRSILTNLVDQLFAVVDDLTGVSAGGGSGYYGAVSPSAGLMEEVDNDAEEEPVETAGGEQKKRKEKRKTAPVRRAPSGRSLYGRVEKGRRGPFPAGIHLTGRDALQQKINAALDGTHLRPESLKTRYIQQYRHHVFFCTFYQTLSPLSHAAAALKSFYDLSMEKRDQYEALYLNHTLLDEDFPVFASFTSTAEELLQVYSPEELRHHRALSADVVCETVESMRKEVPRGIHRSSERMKQHFLRDVDPDSETLVFHRTLLQRTWQHFCRLIEKKITFMEKLLTWPVYSEIPSLQVTRERAMQDMQEV